VRPPSAGEGDEEGIGGGGGGGDGNSVVEQEAEGLECLPGFAGLGVSADEKVEHLRLRSGGGGEEGGNDVAAGGSAPARHAEEETLALGAASGGS
jgi:hypothetical protein